MQIEDSTKIAVCSSVDTLVAGAHIPFPRQTSFCYDQYTFNRIAFFCLGSSRIDLINSFQQKQAGKWDKMSKCQSHSKTIEKLFAKIVLEPGLVL